MNGAATTIPRVVYFIKLDSRFGFLDWVAVMAARKMVKPDNILYFSAGELNSCWWNRTKPLVTHIILTEHVWIVYQNNKYLWEPAHKSDFLRVALVYHLGGMYMDNDIVAVKSFDPLLNYYNQVVLSQQYGRAPSNALILARKHSCFMCSLACQWYDRRWTTHSIDTLNRMVGQELQKFHNVTILQFEHAFLQFGWHPLHLHKLFEVDMDALNFKLSDVYSLLFSNHVSASYQKVLRNITWLLKSSSAAAAAIRMVLPEDFNTNVLDERICTSYSV